MVQPKSDHTRKNPKKIIRNICNTKYNAHTSKLFAENSILKITELYELSTLRLIKKTLNQQTPIRMRDIFTKREEIRPQRNQNIKVHATEGRISHDLPKIWNNLPNELKTETKCKQLTSKIKNKFLEEYKEKTCNKEYCYICNNYT